MKQRDQNVWHYLYVLQCKQTTVIQQRQGKMVFDSLSLSTMNLTGHVDNKKYLSVTVLNIFSSLAKSVYYIYHTYILLLAYMEIKAENLIYRLT